MKYILLCFLLSVSALSFSVNIEALRPIETTEVLQEGLDKPIKYNVTLPHKYTKDENKKYFVLFD